MSHYFDPIAATGYKSPSQRIRRMSEDWLKKNVQCPLCGGLLESYLDNEIGIDFYCDSCGESFQLKAKKGNRPKKLTAANYSKTKAMFDAGNQPHLLLALYQETTYEVHALYFVHRDHLVADMIEPRVELSERARRKKWQGCKWNLQLIQSDGWKKLI